MKKKFGPDKMKTELEFIVCKDSLKSGYDFLLIFQSKEIKIHLLYEAFKSLLKNVLFDICEPDGLKTYTTKSPPSGADLKSLVLEMKAERNARKEAENIAEGSPHKTVECLMEEMNLYLLTLEYSKEVVPVLQTILTHYEL